MSEGSLNRYNPIAPFYDQLARLIFGTNIFQVQIHFFNCVPDNSQVLILGGGTGWIVEELLKLKPGCHVTFVDASSKMISIAKRKNSRCLQNVTFIHGTQDDLPEKMFDVVITNFFLDLFPTSSLNAALQKISNQLTERAIWLVSDFQSPKSLWQKFMLALMYRFFSITTNLRNDRLPDWVESMKMIGFYEEEGAEFANGFMRASLLKKISVR
jgi:tRNA (cmo5U34)-methyltransferase